MKNKLVVLTISIFINVLSLTAQQTGKFTDARDGKTYRTVTIGTQTWMAENLAYKTTGGCWAYPETAGEMEEEEEDLFSNIKIFGYLYNWETAKKVCPAGWHLPTFAEWALLIKNLGGEKGAGYKMKSTTSWSINGSNESGFSALGGGSVNIENNSRFTGIFDFGNWWTASEENDLVWSYRLVHNSNDIYKNYTNRENGLSVRCIRD